MSPTTFLATLNALLLATDEGDVHRYEIDQEKLTEVGVENFFPKLKWIPSLRLQSNLQVQPMTNLFTKFFY